MTQRYSVPSQRELPKREAESEARPLPRTPEQADAEPDVDFPPGEFPDIPD